LLKLGELERDEFGEDAVVVEDVVVDDKSEGNEDDEDK
jgi:hypothetical protein